jgi:hypothetical protein
MLLIDEQELLWVDSEVVYGHRLALPVGGVSRRG